MRTVAVPLGDELVLEERCHVADEQRVHVDPDTAVGVGDEQAQEVAVDPRAAVDHVEEVRALERGAFGERVRVDDADLEVVGIRLEPAGDAWVRAERVVDVCPEDEQRAAEVLGGEEGLDEPLLALLERLEVFAPVCVEEHALAAGVLQLPVGQGDEVVAVSMWMGRLALDGAREVVAVHAEAHGDAALDLEALWGEGRGLVVQL